MCSLADGLAALTDLRVTVQRLILVGGGARSEALQEITAAVFGLPVTVPEPGEYVADGAARQAAGLLIGRFPDWATGRAQEITAEPTPEVIKHYRSAARLANLLES